jgi:hypothetical protein
MGLAADLDIGYLVNVSIATFLLEVTDVDVH